MNPIELLALCSARSADVMRTPGGIARLTGRDVALALALIPDIPRLLLIEEGLEDASGRCRLIGALWRALARERAQWGIDEEDEHAARLTKTLALVIEEVTSPARCARCKGRGTRANPQGVLRTCDFCAGSGRRLPSEAARAVRAGIPYDAWRKTWKARARVITEWVEAERLRGMMRLRDLLMRDEYG